MDWVELVHPKTGHHHRFPMTEGALRGAKARGWTEVRPPKEPAKAVADGHKEKE